VGEQVAGNGGYPFLRHPPTPGRGPGQAGLTKPEDGRSYYVVRDLSGESIQRLRLPFCVIRRRRAANPADL